MSRRQTSSRFSMRKQKSYLTVGVVALAAVIAMAGIYYKKSADEKAEQQEAVIMAESEWDGETDGAADSRDGDSGTADPSVADPSGTEPEGAAQEAADGETEAAEELQTTASIEGETADTVETAAPPSLQFWESDRLDGPVSGDVILNYSMDQSVYFATLDQYKYNPALVIQSDVNTKVLAAADGQVLSVETTPETGETVAVDIGGGYQLVYGQLKEIQFAVGDRVSRGDLLSDTSR